MQEEFKQKWAIVALLEDHKEGYETHYLDSPLHVTLAGVFATTNTGDQLSQELARLLQSQNKVEIEATEKAMFGPNADIAVMKIKKTSELMGLYQKIYDWLDGLNVIYNSPEYQGLGYLPHSTFQKSGVLKEGEKRTLKSISLIDLLPNGDGLQRRITKTIYLS